MNLHEMKLRAKDYLAKCEAATGGPLIAHCSHVYATDREIIATFSNPGKREADYPLVANRDLFVAAANDSPAIAQDVINLAERVEELEANQNARRNSLAQEIRGCLKAHGHWAGNRDDSDLISAVGKVCLELEASRKGQDQ